jgi:hypothetical protein
MHRKLPENISVRTISPIEPRYTSTWEGGQIEPQSETKRILDNKPPKKISMTGIIDEARIVENAGAIVEFLGGVCYACMHAHQLINYGGLDEYYERYSKVQFIYDF